MITIVDYGTGNLRSIANMLRHIGVDCVIAGDPGAIARAGKLILPGVGKYDFGMAALNERGLREVLNRRVLEDGVPVLGICLGAQLLTRGSEEGSLPGLGWIAADTRRFDPAATTQKGLRVPHMGWTDTAFRPESRLAQELEDPRFYYVHSYKIVADRAEDELAHADHGGRFAAGVERGNVLGVQFHPEKSHAFGMKLLENFARAY